MTFCLTNAPTTFFHVMNQVFFNYIDDFVVVYLDDAVDFSESLKDHIVHLGKMLSRLRSTNCILSRKISCLLKRLSSS